MIVVCKPNKSNKILAHQQPVAQVESRKTLTKKFGSKGSADGGKWCPQNTDTVGDSVKKSQPTGGNRSGDDSDVDEWDERRNAMKSRAKVWNRQKPTLQQEC